MPRSFSTTGLILPADREDAGVWGQLVNTNMQALNRLTSESVTISLSGTTGTIALADGTASDGQYAIWTFTGSPSGTNTVTISPSDAQRIVHVRNTTGQDVVLTQGSGGNATIPAGQYAVCFCDGAGAAAAVTNITLELQVPTAVTEQLDGTTPVSGIDINGGSIDGTPVGANSASTGAFTTLSASGGVTVTGDLAATGDVGAATATVTGAATVGAGLTVTGAIDGDTVAGDMVATAAEATAGTANNKIMTPQRTSQVVGVVANQLDGTTPVSGIDIDGGSIDGTPVGATTASTGAFTTLSASGAATFAGDVGAATATITGAVTVGGDLTATGALSGGSIDGTPIGATTASTGAFTTLSTSGAVTFGDTATFTTAASFGGLVSGTNIELTANNPKVTLVDNDSANTAAVTLQNVALRFDIDAPDTVGSSVYRFFVDNVEQASITDTGDVALAGDLIATGDVGGATATITGAATVGAGLAVTGAIDSSGLTVTGDFTLTSTAPTVTVSDTTRDLSLALFTRDGFSGRDDVVLELGGTAVDGFSRVVVRSDGVDCALFSALAQTGVIQTDNLLATSQISGATVTGDMIATQAEAEAGTASNKIMTPERTADAISAQAISPVKAWANFYWDGASVVIRESLNVSSIVRDSTGVFTVTFSSALTDANYAAAGSFSVGDNSTGVLNDGAIKFYNLAAGSMKTSMFDGNGGARDPSYTAQFIVVR